MLSLVASTLVPKTSRATPQGHRLRLVNSHTGETFEGVYRDEQGPLASAMADLSEFLRDFHCGAVIKIDVGVIDYLTAIMDAIGVQTATILSAYRTPSTNAMLAHTTFGVAEHSQHLYGRALDVSVGHKLADAVSAARAMQRGGVGWYPNSGFMHIDTGPVRNWNLDERELRSLLIEGQRLPFKGGAEVASRNQLSPELERSGRLLPEAERSGRPLSGTEDISRRLMQIVRGQRPL